jgi:hypothetical protein
VKAGADAEADIETGMAVETRLAGEAGRPIEVRVGLVEI